MAALGTDLGGLGGGIEADFHLAIRKKIHIRVQQRNGRKCITSIQGLDEDLDLKRICKAMKRSFNCNGNVAEDEEYGEVVQLQGDQRANVREWLTAQEIVPDHQADDRIVLHGF